MKDSAGTYVAMNVAGASAVGTTPEEIVGKDDFGIFPDEIAAGFQREDAEVAATGRSISSEQEIELNGTSVYLHTLKSPWRDQSGNVIGVVGVSRDVTARKRAERALHEAESRFQKLFASDLLGIHIPDRFGAIAEANDEFLRITGYTRADLEAGLVRWDTMTPPEYTPLDQTHISEAATRGSCTPYEKEYVRKDGTRVPIMCGYTLMEGSQDQYIAFIQDMSAIKQSEEALRQAEKLSTAGRFAASMAHEINNPLAAVTNLIYLASRDPQLHTETRSLLQSADKELARVSRIVAQTLRFHKQTSAPIPIEVREIMESVFPLFASRLSADRVTLKKEYKPCSSLWCFSHELRHAFANLVGNALDATPEGGHVRVRIRAGRRWSGSQEHGVVVVVAGTGHGISDRMRQRLFEPFVTTKESTGTGLGLWATEGIVRKHRGRILFRTKTGQAQSGTVFSLFFPFDGVQRPAED
jgi:PAS domain S-box-containing protein